jgi:hypothetical protein
LPFRKSLQESIASDIKSPKLLGLLANLDAPSRAYADWTARACQAIGIVYELREVDGSLGEGQVEEAILAANNDESINGIMVYVSSFSHPEYWVQNIHKFRRWQYPIFGPRQGPSLEHTCDKGYANTMPGRFLSAKYCFSDQGRRRITFHLAFRPVSFALTSPRFLNYKSNTDPDIKVITTRGTWIL